MEQGAADNKQDVTETLLVDCSLRRSENGFVRIGITENGTEQLSTIQKIINRGAGKLGHSITFTALTDSCE